MNYNLSIEQQKLLLFITNPHHDSELFYKAMISSNSSVVEEEILMKTIKNLGVYYLQEMLKVKRLIGVQDYFPAHALPAGEEELLTTQEQNDITERLRAFFQFLCTDSRLKPVFVPHKFKYFIYWISAVCDVELMQLVVEVYPEMFYGTTGSMIQIFDCSWSNLLKSDEMIDKFVELFVLPTEQNPEGYKSEHFDEYTTAFFGTAFFQSIVQKYDSRHKIKISAMNKPKDTKTKNTSTARLLSNLLKNKSNKIHPI